MTRKTYLRKRAYLCKVVLDWNKKHAKNLTPEMIKQANKAMFNRTVPEFKNGPYRSYQEAYDAIYDVLKIFIEEA